MEWESSKHMNAKYSVSEEIYIMKNQYFILSLEI